MKQNLTEVARLQKLAGIKSNLYEIENLEENSEISDDEIASAINKITKGAIPTDAVDVSKLKSDPNSKDAIEIEKVKKPSEGEKINEMVLSATLVLLAPVIADLIGKKINSIKQKNASVYMTPAQIEKVKEIEKELDKLRELKKKYDEENLHDKENEVVDKIEHLEHEKDKISGTSVGNSMIKLGHFIHKVYVAPIKAILDAKAWFNRAFDKEKGTTSRFNTDERYRKNIANVIYCGIMIFISLKAFLAHPAEAAAQISKNTGGMISVSTIASLANNIKGANSLKDAIQATLETI